MPITERLLEFAQQGWKNKAFRQMTFGLYCPPMAFCEQAKVSHATIGGSLSGAILALLGCFVFEEGSFLETFLRHVPPLSDSNLSLWETGGTETMR